MLIYRKAARPTTAARPAPERAATLPAPAVGTSSGAPPVGVATGPSGLPGLPGAVPVGTTGTKVELPPLAGGGAGLRHVSDDALQLVNLGTYQSWQTTAEVVITGLVMVQGQSVMVRVVASVMV